MTVRPLAPRPERAPDSTRTRVVDMLARAPAMPGRGRMTAQREFSDGELIPGTRYRVVGLIGSGGMGSVYEVEHVELGKRFVLKALLRSLTNRDDLVHRLRNEWRALGKLEHRNIVSVTDAGITTTGLPYFVMERLQGETLAVRLRRERRIPVRDAITIAADVLEGLSAAHRIGIVHRDVKPPNIFLVKKRPAKLLDFGIAKVLDPKASQITGRGIAIGTPRYMAPEQATGGAVDARTDLYSVGLILFEMIAGAGPFDGARDPNEVFLAHIAKTAPPLTSVAPLAPAALDSWVARLLAKKPELRPDDAEAVARALRELVTELKPSSLRPAAREGDDPTLAGGPFDTLEAAQTVPSEPPPQSVRTRAGIGPASGLAAQPWHLTELESGRTLRLDAFTSGGETPTRTAAPVPAPDTPIPVTETPPFSAPKSDWKWAWIGVLVAGVGAVAAGVAISARSAEAGKGAEAGASRAIAAAMGAHVATTPAGPAGSASPSASKEATAIPALAEPIAALHPAPRAGASSGPVMEGKGTSTTPARFPAATPSAAPHPARLTQKPRIVEDRSPSGSELPSSGL